jgi:hypothetical protein
MASWDGMAASWVPYAAVPSSTQVVEVVSDVIQAGVLGSGNTALLVKTSSGSGADGDCIQTSGLGSVFDGGSDEIGVGVLSGGADIKDKGGGVLHHTLSTRRGCTGLGSYNGALGCGGAI